MADMFEKALLIGLGLEKKAKDALTELEKITAEAAARATATKTADAPKPGLDARQTLENKVVEDGVKALKEFLAVVRSAKEKLEKEVLESSGRVANKLNLATAEDVEVIKDMARVAREKVDKLEKRLDELEARLAR